MKNIFIGLIALVLVASAANTVLGGGAASARGDGQSLSGLFSAIDAYGRRETVWTYGEHQNENTGLTLNAACRQAWSTTLIFARATALCIPLDQSDNRVVIDFTQDALPGCQDEEACPAMLLTDQGRLLELPTHYRVARQGAPAEGVGVVEILDRQAFLSAISGANWIVIAVPVRRGGWGVLPYDIDGLDLPDETAGDISSRADILTDMSHYDQQRVRVMLEAVRTAERPGPEISFQKAAAQ